MVNIAMPTCGFSKSHLFVIKGFPYLQLALYGGVHISWDKSDLRLKMTMSLKKKEMVFKKWVKVMTAGYI